jgi:hypothetical protein
MRAVLAAAAEQGLFSGVAGQDREAETGIAHSELGLRKLAGRPRWLLHGIPSVLGFSGKVN